MQIAHNLGFAVFYLLFSIFIIDSKFLLLLPEFFLRNNPCNEIVLLVSI